MCWGPNALESAITSSSWAVTRCWRCAWLHRCARCWASSCRCARCSKRRALPSSQSTSLHLQRESRALVAPPLVAQERTGSLPFSYAQERLWFIEQMNLSTSPYNNFLTRLELSGRLDMSALEAAFAELVRRHESLRTRIEVLAGVPVQKIDAPDSFQLIGARMLSSLPPPQQAARVLRTLQAEADHRFSIWSEARCFARRC